MANLSVTLTPRVEVLLYNVTHSETTTQDLQDDRANRPPDGGYGWICVACCFAVNCFTWGVVSVSMIAATILGVYSLCQC